MDVLQAILDFLGQLSGITELINLILAVLSIIGLA